MVGWFLLGYEFENIVTKNMDTSDISIFMPKFVRNSVAHNLFHRGRSDTLRFHLCCRLNYKNLVKPVEKIVFDRYNIFYVLSLVYRKDV
jgi:hypothetical protein